MSDIIQLRIDGKLIGVVGLQKIMEEMAGAFADTGDMEISKELLLRAAKHNYIPRRVEEAYGLALLREFRRFLGQDVEETLPTGLHIVVLGPGCARCSRLERDVRDALAELGLPGELLHVDDLREIARYGVMGVPALIVNGRVHSVGTTQEKEELKKWLRAAVSTA